MLPCRSPRHHDDNEPVAKESIGRTDVRLAALDSCLGVGACSSG